MSKAIILGHGFISSHLEKRLKDDGMIVEVMSDKDIHYSKKLECDYLFRLSAYGNHYNQCLYNTDEWKMIEANILNLFQLLEFTKDVSYKVFINFSTSSVTLPIQTVYSATKHSGEYICEAFCQKYRKPIVSVRPYSVYGPGEADFRFIPTIINKGLNGDKPKVILEPRHDWIYVEDLINAVLLIVKNIGILRDQLIPIGTGISWSNQEIVDIIDEIFKQYDDNYKEIFYDVLLKDLREYDTQEWVANISILKSLGWSQKYSLREGLIECFKYYKKKHEAA